MIKDSIPGLIVAGVVAALSMLGYVAVIVMKVPDLERTLEKHNHQLVTHAARIIFLEGLLDKPVKRKDIEDLIDHLAEAKAPLIDRVQVTGFNTGLAFVSWLPRDQVEKYKGTFEPGTFEPADDEAQTKKVATYLSAATLTLRPTKWSVDGHNLVGSQQSGTFVFSAANDVTSEDLKAWAFNLNDLSSATANATLDATDEDLNEN